MMEQVTFDFAPAPEAATQAIEDWARQKRTDPTWFFSAKFARRWGRGKVVSESEYDAAIHEVQNITLR